MVETREKTDSFISRIRYLLWATRRMLLNKKVTQLLSSEPYPSHDSYRCACDFVFDKVDGLTFLPHQVTADAWIFVEQSHAFLDYFFSRIHPRIPEVYTLVTAGDGQISPEHLPALEDEQLVRWCATNVDATHPKLVAIPYGVVSERTIPGYSNILRHIDEEGIPKTKLAYANFSLSSNVAKRGKVASCLHNLDFVTRSPRKAIDDYLRDIASHRFVVSPPGLGVDCVRTWEALLLGSIPIVERCPHMSHFCRFPSLFIDDWSHISEQYLAREEEQIRSRPFDRMDLFMPYWTRVIAGRI